MPQTSYLEPTSSEFIHSSKLESEAYLIIAYLVLINSIAIVLMWYDKIQSKRKGNRIPEKILLFFALFGGALGSYIGMLSVRHKTAKLTFKIGIPFIILLHALVIFWLLSTN